MLIQKTETSQTYVDEMEEGIIVARSSRDQVTSSSNGSKAVVARVQEGVYGRRDGRSMKRIEERRGNTGDGEDMVGLGILHEGKVLGGHVVNGTGTARRRLLRRMRGRVGVGWRAEA